MPQMYDPPVSFLKVLSRKVLEGWAVIDFDYLRERLIVKNQVGELQKAVVQHGRVEWMALTQQEIEVVRGTERFFIL